MRPPHFSANMPGYLKRVHGLVMILFYTNGTLSWPIAQPPTWRTRRRNSSEISPQTYPGRLNPPETEVPFGKAFRITKARKCPHQVKGGWGRGWQIDFCNSWIRFNSVAALASWPPEKKKKKNCPLLKPIMEQKTNSVVKNKRQQISHSPHCTLALVKGSNEPHEA